jgi:hypothetical protein
MCLEGLTHSNDGLAAVACVNSRFESAESDTNCYWHHVGHPRENREVNFDNADKGRFNEPLNNLTGEGQELQM